MPKALQTTPATAGRTWATSKAAVVAGTKGDNPFQIVSIRFTAQTLVSQLCGRTVGPGQQAGAPFFSQNPTIPGSEPCCCQEGEELQCTKGREEEKRRHKRACVCAGGRWRRRVRTDQLSEFG